MTNYLVFQLYGSLAAWGEPAVGEVRHTSQIPGRSAIMGLLAAALGIRREQEEQLGTLQTHYHIALRQLISSNWLRDYHTTQVPGENRKYHYATRREELLLAPRELVSDGLVPDAVVSDKLPMACNELQTILSTRDYLCDAYYLLAIRATDNAPYQLEELQHALLTPVFPLYLGRKSCPPGLPLAPRCVRAELAQVLGDENILYPQLRPRKGWGKRCFWEGTAKPAGLHLHQTVNRADQPVSRRRWQFTRRLQHQGWLTGDDNVSVQS